MSDVLQALRASTVLARIHTTALGIQRVDRNASERVIDENKAARGTAKVQVSRIAGSEKYHRTIVAAQARARDVLVQFSTPFRDDGWRVLPNVRFMAFVKAYAPVKRAFDDARQDMLDNVDDIIFKAKSNMGGLSVDVPTYEEIEAAYTLGFDVQDYPEGKFGTLPESTVASLQRAMNARIEQAWADAKTDLLRRIHAPLNHYLDRIEQYEQRLAVLDKGGDPGKSGTFYGSMIDNLREAVELAKAMNVDNDPTLSAATASLEAFVSVDPADVKKDNELRGALTKTARDAAANLKSWINK